MNSLDDEEMRRTERAIRWVRPENVHLTLKFLGEIKPERANQIADVLDELAGSSPQFAIEVGGFGCFPNLSRPRVIWIGLTSLENELHDLQQALEEKLEEIGIKKETRKFHPHLTIGRVRKGLSRTKLKELSVWLSSVRVGRLGSFELREIKLMKSVLEPTGAVYSVLHEAEIS